MTTIRKVVDGKEVGKISFNLVHANMRELRIHIVHVYKGYQGKGYGKGLMEQAIKIAKGSKCDIVSLYATENFS